MLLPSDGCSTHPVWGIDIHPTVDEMLHNIKVSSSSGHMQGCAEQLGER